MKLEGLDVLENRAQLGTSSVDQKIVDNPSLSTERPHGYFWSLR